MGFRFDVNNLSPYDLSGQINEEQKFSDFFRAPSFNFKQGTQVTKVPGAAPWGNDPRSGHPALGSAEQFHYVQEDTTTAIPDTERNRNAFQTQLNEADIGGVNTKFNVPLNIERDATNEATTKTFADQIAMRNRLAKDAENNVNNNQARIFADFVEKDQQAEAMKGVPTNALGRVQLVQRLKRQFGPGFLGVPAAKAIIDQFDAILAQRNDVSNIEKLVAQGTTALSFLQGNQRVPSSPLFANMVGNVAGAFKTPPTSNAPTASAAPNFGAGVGFTSR